MLILRLFFSDLLSGFSPIAAAAGRRGHRRCHHIPRTSPNCRPGGGGKGPPPIAVAVAAAAVVVCFEGSLPPPSMNLRILSNIPSPPPFSLLQLPWRGEPETDPIPAFSHPPPPPPPPPPPRLDPRGAFSLFDIGGAIVRAFRSLVAERGRNPAPLARPARLGRRRDGAESSGCALQLFRPYVAKVPWHGGVRAFLSQLFPRYGHYCGPNWSSGKDGGLPLWDRRPIDWLDFCCYCHDIGYDTHDQAKLLQADLAFLECLERPRMATKGDARLAYLYKTMCIAGLRNILIPYRMQLVRMQTGPSFMEVMNSLIGKSRSCGQRLGKAN